MYLNVLQLAESFGVSEGVIEDWVVHEDLPHIRDGDRLLFDRAQVADWASRRGWTTRVGFLAPDPPRAGTVLALEPLLRRGGIWREIAPEGLVALWEGVLRRIPAVSSMLVAWVVDRLRRPGGINWAPVGHGLALPHLSTRVSLGPNAGCVVVTFLREPLKGEVSTPDGMPVDRLVFFQAPMPRGHLELLGRLSHALREGPLREALRSGAPDDAIYRAAREADQLVLDERGVGMEAEGEL